MTRRKPIRVTVVEDENLVALLLCACLSEDKQIELVGRAPDGSQGLQLCRSSRPDVVLLDIMMPGIDGLTLAEQLIKEMPDLKIIILSARSDPYAIYRIKQLGIPGYVDKGCDPDVLSTAIRTVMRGGKFHTPLFDDAWRQLWADSNAFFKVLSARQIEVLQLLTKGLSLEEVAKQLNLTVQTAKTHQKHIYKKLGAHTAADLLRQSLKAGLVRPDPGSKPCPSGS